MAKTELTQTPSNGARSAFKSATARKLLMGVAILTLGACAAPAGLSQTQKSFETAGVPSVSRSMLDLADQMASEGKYAAALPLYRRAQELDGDSETAAMGYGTALLQTGRKSEALKVFEQAADEFESSAAPLEGIGRAWMAMNRPATALASYEAALVRNPGSAKAMNGKGVALASMGQTKQAISAFEAGLRRAPNDLALKNNYGLALTLDDQADLGVPVLEEVAQDDAATAGNRQSLAMAYGVAGQTEDARNIAAIDLDLIDVERQISSYRTLAAMPPEKRAPAAMSSLGSEKRDLDKPANRVFLEPVDALATVRRLLAEPTVVAQVEAVPEPVLEPEPVPEPVEEAMDIPPLDDNVGYAVQIAAYRHKSELNPGWDMLREKYKDLIGDLEPRRSEVDFGNRDTNPKGFYYRLNAGPLNSFRAARTVCDAISSQGGDCWVRPPLPTEGRVPTAEKPQEDGALSTATAVAETLAEPAATAVVEAAPQDAAATPDDGDVWVAIDEPQSQATEGSAQQVSDNGPEDAGRPSTRPLTGDDQPLNQMDDVYVSDIQQE